MRNKGISIAMIVTAIIIVIATIIPIPYRGGLL